MSTLHNINDVYSGVYSLLVTDSRGCEISDSLVVSDLPAGVLSVSVIDSVKCYGDDSGQVEFEMTGGFGDFSYSINGDSVQLNQVFSNLIANDYIVEVIDAEGCIVTDSFAIGSAAKIDVVINTVSDTTICFGNCLELSADISGGMGTFETSWDTNVLGNNITVCPDSTTVYNLVVSDSNNCSVNGGRVRVNVKDPITLSAIASPSHICPGDSSTIKITAIGGTGTYTMSWSDDQSIISDTRFVGPVISTTYDVLVSDGCTTPSQSISVNIDVYNTPNMRMTSNVNEGCEGVVIDLNHIIIPEPYAVQYEINGPDTVMTGGEDDVADFRYNTAGAYDITMNIVTEDGCKDSITFDDYITIYPVPNADFTYSPEDPSYVNSTIQFFDQSTTPFGENELWEWELQSADYYIEAEGETTIIEFPDSGMYETTLTVTNSYGCEDTKVVNVEVEDSYLFYIPNAFTPQSDGLNETFGPITRGVDNSTYKFTVFNRWGELIFESTSPEYWWNGELENGTKVQMDAYVWVCNFRKSTDHKQVSLTGTVSVLR
tara:strand:- start:739 stop:2373 length:1635 start_codon:yes stop_codon:yes gene_type:complete